MLCMTRRAVIDLTQADTIQSKGMNTVTNIIETREKTHVVPRQQVGAAQAGRKDAQPLSRCPTGNGLDGHHRSGSRDEHPSLCLEAWSSSKDRMGKGTGPCSGCSIPFNRCSW